MKYKNLHLIAACEPAGPLFYPTTLYHETETADQKAAKNVQCIHTSSTLGTVRYDCDQDWIMGDCGITQAATSTSLTLFANHDMCPIFYTLAFEYNFTAVDNKCCLSSKRNANVSELPPDYKMGYMQKNKG